MKKRVFITGPTGAIGTALVKYLIELGYEVVAICRENSKRMNEIADCKNVKIIECSLENIGRLTSDTLGNGDFFFHLAWAGTNGQARNNLELQLDNVHYALQCVRLAKELNCKKFIGVGSQAEYGIANEKLSSKTPVNPITGYGVAKLTSSYMCRMEAQTIGIEYNWVRILSIYGPNDGMHTLMMTLIANLHHNEKIALTNGIQMWDYLYSGDAARALYLIATSGINQKNYVLGSGKAMALRQYIEIVNGLIPNHSELQWGKVPYSTQSIMYLCADLEELTHDTGFLPQIDFYEGMTKTIQWYKEKYEYEEN